MNLSGRQRLAIVVSVFWVVGSYFLFEPYSRRGSWQGFVLLGVGPVGASWAWYWVRKGFDAERQKGTHLDDSMRLVLAKRLELSYQIVVKSYRYDSSKMLHILGIGRGKESGELAFSSEFIRDHTVSGVIQELTTREVMRQFDDFNNRRVVVGNTGVRIEPGT